jgi:retrograde regulation protein 2
MDLGGGSVQMTYVNSMEREDYDIVAAEAATSLPFGAAKVTAALKDQQLAAVVKKELPTNMKATFEGLLKKFPSLSKQVSDDGVTIYFCGGGFRGYGSMLMHTDPIQPYPIPAIGGYTVPGNRFVQWREMHHVNTTEEGKIFGMSKRRREQFHAIVTVVQALVEAIPKIKEVVFCSGGNREGVLFMKLPPETRESHPLPLLPVGAPNQDSQIVEAIEKKIISALPISYPSIFSNELIHYIVRNIWLDMGDPADANASKALHNPVSGLLAGLPGLTHELRAVIAITLCFRWGNALGTADSRMYENLVGLIGNQLGWWCEYIGALAATLATVFPVFPSTYKALDMIRFTPTTQNHGLGKKGKKAGIRLKIELGKELRRGVSAGEVEYPLSKVGKGLVSDWRVEAEVDSDED